MSLDVAPGRGQRSGGTGRGGRICDHIWFETRAVPNVVEFRPGAVLAGAGHFFHWMTNRYRLGCLLLHLTQQWFDFLWFETFHFRPLPMAQRQCHGRRMLAHV